MYVHTPPLVTTTLVGYVPSNVSLALLYINMSGAQMRDGGIRMSAMLPYSDSFHRKLLSIHSCKNQLCTIVQRLERGDITR